MQTGAQISAYLLDSVELALRRPAMYHGSPKSMEECFFLLDDLLAFIAGNQRGLYAEYLVEQGYQAARFTTFPPGDGSGRVGTERFAAFVAFCTAYMKISPNFRRDAMPDPEEADHA